MNKLVFQNTPEVELGSNIFKNCPIILQFDDTPLISIVRHEQAGFTTEIPIFHSDGTYLAKIVGSQIFKTEDGNKAGIELEHPDKMTVCKLAGKTLFEIRRKDAASLRTEAELYTPTGYFVKYTGDRPGLIDVSREAIKIGGMIMTRNTFEGCDIGVWIKSDGIVSMGCTVARIPKKKLVTKPKKGVNQSK